MKTRIHCIRPSINVIKELKGSIVPSHPDSRPNTTRRVRLKGFDYRTPGFYFITICQQDRRHLFSRIDDGMNQFSPSGLMLIDAVVSIANRFQNASVDAFVIMPNHAHILLGMNLADTTQTQDSVIDVIGWWKTVTTRRYIEGVKRSGWPRFNGKLWQEGYHDRIVRDQRELEHIRYYIEQNPARWEEDTFFDGN